MQPKVKLVADLSIEQKNQQEYPRVKQEPKMLKPKQNAPINQCKIPLVFPSILVRMLGISL